MTQELLPLLPHDTFSRVLCVVAHPDDVEYGTSPAVAAWTAAGAEVSYLLLTRGEAGMDSLEPEATAALRAEEQLAACQAVGVDKLEILDYPDGVLEYSIEMRRDISRRIRAFRPDAVVLGSWDVEFIAGLNQADHRVAGLAALDAIRDAGNRWVFTELIDEGLLPHSVRWLLVGGDSRPTHAVDVTGEPVERGIAALEAHAQYLATIANHPPVRGMIAGLTGYQGRAAGVANAVLFRAWDFQAPPPIIEEMMRAQATPQSADPSVM